MCPGAELSTEPVSPNLAACCYICSMQGIWLDGLVTTEEGSWWRALFGEAVCRVCFIKSMLQS